MSKEKGKNELKNLLKQTNTLIETDNEGTLDLLEEMIKSSNTNVSLLLSGGEYGEKVVKIDQLWYDENRKELVVDSYDTEDLFDLSRFVRDIANEEYNKRGENYYVLKGCGHKKECEGFDRDNINSNGIILNIVLDIFDYQNGELDIEELSSYLESSVKELKNVVSKKD